MQCKTRAGGPGPAPGRPSRSSVDGKMAVRGPMVFGLLLAHHTWSAGAGSSILTQPSPPPLKPSIAFVVIDDLGFDDTSLHGSTQIPTPTLASLAKEGILLNNYYVMPVCTPTRSAIHTGRHPIHTGMQGGALLGQQRLGLPVGIVTLPEQLQKLGYKCYATGKWVIAFHTVCIVNTPRAST